MKNIIIFSVNYEPWISGAELFVKEVVVRQKQEYHFIVITARQSRSVPTHEERDGVGIVRVGFGFRFDKWLYPVLAPFAAIRHPHVLVHAVMESYAGIALWLYGFLSKRPKMLTLQSGDLDDKAAAGKIPAWLWKRIHTAPDFVTAISSFLADRAARLRGSRENVAVIPNGVDLELVGKLHREIPRQARDDKQKNIICVARLSPEKGLEYLLRAMPRVRARVPEAMLTIVGGGALEESLKTLARELGIESYVTFRGALSHEAALREILKSDVFVCPSLAEGLGIVFIEAQACGVPVLGTAVGGIPDVIEHGKTGLLVPPKDADAIARALGELLTDSGLRSRLAAAAQESVRKFSWDLVVGKVKEVYEAVGVEKGSEGWKREARGKIVFAAGTYPPDVGGPATVAHELVEQFHGLGYGTVVVRYGEGDGAVSRRGSVIARYARYALAIAKVSRGADAILAFDAVGSGIPAMLAHCITRKPLVVRVGGDYFWEMASMGADEVLTFKDYWKRGPRAFHPVRLLMKIVFFFAHEAVFNSEKLAATYVAHGLVSGRKVVVITNAMPPLREIPLPCRQAGRQARDDKRDVLFAGRFIKLKNIPRLLEAVALLKKQGTGVQLMLVGSGPEEGHIRAIVGRMGLEGSVTILPPQPGETLIELISESAAVVLPSYSEVSPQLVSQSLAARVPIIMTRHHFLPEPVREFLIEIDPNNPQEIANAIKNMLNPLARKGWEERLSEKYQERSTEMVAQEYLEVLKGFTRMEKGGKGWIRGRARWWVKTVVYGIASVQRLWYRGPRLAIFLYHDIGYNSLYLTVRHEALRAHIKRLKYAGFSILPLREVVQALKAKQPLPKRAAVITFDDGTLGQYEHAYRICKEESVPATFFITTGRVGGEAAFSQGSVPGITWEHLEEMIKTPGIVLEPHTVTHRHFDKISNDEVLYESRESKRILEERLGISCRVFAYPSGEYEDLHEQLVARAGYDAAVTVDQELVPRENADLFALPRVTVDSGLPMVGILAATVPWGVRLLRIIRDREKYLRKKLL